MVQNDYTGLLVTDGRGIGYFYHFAGVLILITTFTLVW